MKLNLIGKHATALGAAGLLAVPAALAGPLPPPPMEPVPPPPPPPVEYGALWDDMGATLSAGWDSDYVWRGLDLGETLIWTDLNLNFDLDDWGGWGDWGDKPDDDDFDLDLNIGAWYADIHSAGTSDLIDQELDLYAGFTIGLGPVDLNFGYIYYFFDSDANEFHEGYVGLGVAVGPLDLGLTGFYEIETESIYIQFTAEMPIALTSWMDLRPGFVASYRDGNDGYLIYNDSDFNHIGVSLALDIRLTPSATLSPYIAYVHQFEGDEDDDIFLDEDDFAFGQHEDKFYGGVKLSVTF
ncbi:MAG TPA: hypothetical protein VMN36_08555 [Verrucomicrobiales bacterium]|nr:hypothetical protein [Verrucomicrobiales bacterium]